MTTRLSADERKHFATTVQRGWDPGRTEPALGTLNDRLGIIIRRQGGTTSPVKAGTQERLAYAGWLAENGLTS